jgi:hypothetical protein
MARPEPCRRRRLRVAGSACAAAAALGLASDLQFKKTERPLADDWRTVPVWSSPSTMLGISFRPRQAEAFDLEPAAALSSLLDYRFDVIRLGAYWNRLEPEAGRFDPYELDWQVDAAEAAGKRVIICVGPIKCFGYPEYFVPDHTLDGSLPEHRIISPDTHPSLFAASIGFLQRVVERYAHREWSTPGVSPRRL